MTKPIILLDCDQCVLDYNKRVGDIFKELFGYEPLVKNPKAYKAVNIYDFSTLTQKENDFFKQYASGPNMWDRMNPMPGAKEMVDQLSHDHDVIIFTGMNPDFKSIREKNLRDLGMNIKDVVAVANSRSFNAKEKYAREVNAKFFIDDLLQYFVGLQDISTELVLLDHGYNDGANNEEERRNILVNHTVTSLEQVVKLIC